MKVIYHDIDKSAARIRWQGVGFLDGVPTEFPDEFRGKIEGNPFFEIVVEEMKKETLHLPAKSDKPRG